MQDLPNHFAYRQDVIEFVTVGVQVCAYLSTGHEADDKYEMTDRLLRLLPLLYLKTQMIAGATEEYDDYLETFCTEPEYDAVRSAIAEKYGSDDTFLDVMVDDSRYTDEPLTCFLSENLADIYQEMRDLAGRYQTQEPEVMRDAVMVCLEAFKMHWGQKLLNALRALHVLACDPAFLKGEDE